MSLEKFFCGESSTFLFVFLALFWFLDGVLPLFTFGLWCVSAWFVVRFNIV